MLFYSPCCILSNLFIIHVVLFAFPPPSCYFMKINAWNSAFSVSRSDRSISGLRSLGVRFSPPSDGVAIHMWLAHFSGGSFSSAPTLSFSLRRSAEVARDLADWRDRISPGGEGRSVRAILRAVHFHLPCCVHALSSVRVFFSASGIGTLVGNLSPVFFYHHVQ